MKGDKMDNVVQMELDADHEKDLQAEIRNAKDDLYQIISDITQIDQDIKTLKEEEWDLNEEKTRASALKNKLKVASINVDLAEIKTKRLKTQEERKQLLDDRRALEKGLTNDQAKLKKLQSASFAEAKNEQKEAEKEYNLTAIEDYMIENDAYYIIKNKHWVRLRFEDIKQTIPVVEMLDGTEMADLVYLHTDNDVSTAELKKMAKSFDRQKEGLITCPLDHDYDKERYLNEMELILKHKMKPNFDYDFENDPLDIIANFDLLVQSLGGGKQENIDAIEQFTAYKWFNPTDPSTPAFDASGAFAVGKSRFAEDVLTPILAYTVGMINSKTINGDFNRLLRSITLAVLEEEAGGDISEQVIKRITGAKILLFEDKGKDAFRGYRTFSFLAFTNDEAGTLTLTGNMNGDRRYSVVRCTESLNYWVGKKLAKNWNEAEDYIWSKWYSSISDYENIRIWLAHLINKHEPQKMKRLKPHHGEDYNLVIKNQMTPTELYCLKILNNIGVLDPTTCIPTPFLYKMVQAHHNKNGHKIPAEATVVKAFLRVANIQHRNWVTVDGTSYKDLHATKTRKRKDILGDHDRKDPNNHNDAYSFDMKAFIDTSLLSGIPELDQLMVPGPFYNIKSKTTNLRIL